MMKLTEMRKLSKADVVSQISSLRAELSEQMLTYRTKETKNVRSIRAIKKDLARLLTIQNESREQEAADV